MGSGTLVRGLSCVLCGAQPQPDRAAVAGNPAPWHATMLVHVVYVLPLLLMGAGGAAALLPRYYATATELYS